MDRVITLTKAKNYVTDNKKQLLRGGLPATGQGKSSGKRAVEA